MRTPVWISRNMVNGLTLIKRKFMKKIEPEDIFAKRCEQVFGGGFGLGAVLQVEKIFGNRRVCGERARIRGRRQKFYTLARSQFLQGVEDFRRVHW